MDKLTTLHIGTTKTGSTSIQSFLARNRAQLATKGVIYPKALGAANHNTIPVYLQGKWVDNGLQARQNIKTADDYAIFKEELPGKLIAEVGELNPDHFIVSNEHMHSRCFKPSHFKRLKKLLNPVLTDRKIQVIVYLRPQIAHVVSLYSTMLGHGLTATLDEFILSKMSGRSHDYFNFRVLLDAWTDAFPEAAFFVRPFADVAAREHGVLTDFLELTQLAKFAGDMTFEPRRNESLGTWPAETLRQLNALNPELPPNVSQIIRRWLRNELPAGRVLPDIDVARSFQDSFSDDNREVCKTYFNGDTTAFDVDWSKYATLSEKNEPKPEQLISLLMKITNGTALDFDRSKYEAFLGSDALKPEKLISLITEITKNTRVASK